MAIQITIIEYVADNRVVVKCAFCKGTGKSASWPCPKCNGRGVLLLEIDGELPLVVCAFCKGTGKSASWACPKCDGSGAQPIVGKAKILG